MHSQNFLERVPLKVLQIGRYKFGKNFFSLIFSENIEYDSSQVYFVNAIFLPSLMFAGKARSLP